MALKTDDIDIRDVRMYMEFGGNGDYYIVLCEMGKQMFDKDGKLTKLNVPIYMRISTSGGYAPHEVKMAVGQLYNAMQQHELNEHPYDEISKDDEWIRKRLESPE